MGIPDKYGQAIGLWHLEVGDFNKDLKPKVGDNRRFRNILMNEEFKKDKGKLFDAFEDWMVEVIKRDYPPSDAEEELALKWYVELNCNSLFEEVMIKFRWTTKEDMEKSKKELVGDLKKLTEGN